MSLIRSFRLVGYHNKQFFLKLRYDLGRELVVLISSAVLLGLFAYIFRDFIQEKLRAIPPSEQMAIARAFATLLLLLTGPLIASPLHKLWREMPSLRGFAFRSGEDPLTIRGFLLTQTALVLIVGCGLYWLAIGGPWGRWSIGAIVLWQSLSLALGVLRFTLHREKSAPSFKPLLSDAPSGRIQTLIAWRWKQIFLRNRIARLCLSLALVMQLITGLAFAYGAPFPLAILMAMATGLLIACGPSFQLEEDMRAIWFERQIACSHEEYVSVYQNICLRLALIFGTTILVIAFATHGLDSPLDTLKLAAITALFPALLPAVMFQIAPERPLLQIMTITLIGLFLGTAIFAHWGAIVLVPIALSYAKQYQKNNFYRS